MFLTCAFDLILIYRKISVISNKECVVEYPNTLEKYFRSVFEMRYFQKKKKNKIQRIKMKSIDCIDVTQGSVAVNGNNRIATAVSSCEK